MRELLLYASCSMVKGGSDDQGGLQLHARRKPLCKRVRVEQDVSFLDTATVSDAINEALNEGNHEKIQVVWPSLLASNRSGNHDSETSCMYVWPMIMESRIQNQLYEG